MPTTIKDELLRTGRIVYTNKGVSMLPLLRQDKDIMIIEARKEPLKCLDAVLFERQNGTLVLHRILKIQNGVYWIIGDNCCSGEYVSDSAILGILKAVKRGSRTISVTDPVYRLYVYIWCAPYPLRIAIQFLFRLPGRCVRKAWHTVKKLWNHS